MRDPEAYIIAKYPGNDLHAVVDEQQAMIEADVLHWNMSHVPGTPGPDAQQGDPPPMIANPNYDPLWRTVHAPVDHHTQ